MEKIIIAAIAENNVIGKDGSMPWHIKEELKHFKRTTLGNPVIMGRKTFESFGSKPLKERLNIILTSNKDSIPAFNNVETASGLEEAYSICETKKSEKVFIAGGYGVYRDALQHCDKMILSRLKLNVEGDTFFPDFDERKWDVISVEKFDEFDVYTYIRK